MDSTGPGVMMPLLLDGTKDIFSMPDMSNRKLYMFPLLTYEVVYSFVRTRLRKSKYDLSGLEELFTRCLPEFSSYVINQLVLEANTYFKNPLPENIRIYKEDIANFTWNYDVQKHKDICDEYAGPPPITKSHFIKILHLTSLVAYNIVGRMDPSVRTKFMNKLIGACFEVLQTTVYSDYLNEHPWHTWFNPLTTFPVSNHQVIKSVVRSRLCKILKLDQLRYKELYSKHPLFVWLFQEELPEWSHYQIRCIIDELEDLERIPDVFPPGTRMWIDKLSSTSSYINFYKGMTKKLFDSESQPMGILKVLLLTCLMIERFFSQGIYRSATNIMEEIQNTLDGPVCEEILLKHPWDTWYNHQLNWPAKRHKRNSRYIKTIYHYPVQIDELDFDN